MNREETIRRMRARHSLAARRDSAFPVTGPWSFRELCEHDHGWTEIDEHWLQCVICWWCKPKLGRPPKLERLPSILKGCVLPPLSGRPDLLSLYANAGFVIDEDRSSVLSLVRVRVVQYSWGENPDVRRCGVEVRFKEHGWKEAAVFMETWLIRLIKVLSNAEPRKPKALWKAVQKAMEQSWQPPWEKR